MPNSVAAVLGSKTAGTITDLVSRAVSEGFNQVLGAQERGLGDNVSDHQSKESKDKEGSELRHRILKRFLLEILDNFRL